MNVTFTFVSITLLVSDVFRMRSFLKKCSYYIIIGRQKGADGYGKKTDY